MSTVEHSDTCDLHILPVEQGGVCSCDATTNIGEAKSVGRRATKAERAQAAKDLAVANLMATVGGRAWIGEKLTQAHVHASSFDPNPLVMAFREGERNLGNAMLADIVRVAPADYMRMNGELAHAK